MIRTNPDDGNVCLATFVGETIDIVRRVTRGSNFERAAGLTKYILHVHDDQRHLVRGEVVKHAHSPTAFQNAFTNRVRDSSWLHKFLHSVCLICLASSVFLRPVS